MMIPEKNIAAFVYNRLYLTQIIMEKNIMIQPKCTSM